MTLFITAIKLPNNDNKKEVVKLLERIPEQLQLTQVWGNFLCERNNGFKD